MGTVIQLQVIPGLVKGDYSTSVTVKPSDREVRLCNNAETDVHATSLKTSSISQGCVQTHSL